MDPWEQHQRNQARRDLRDIADNAREQQRARLNYRPPVQQGPHVNIDLGPVVMAVRAWNRFARRRLPKGVRITLNTIFILIPVLLVIGFVQSITGH
jgi:hypothetical protein